MGIEIALEEEQYYAMLIAHLFFVITLQTFHGCYLILTIFKKVCFPKQFN